jgi:hypothetical protein
MAQYDRRYNLPAGVDSALREGFTIVHKGILCWTKMPGPLLKIPLRAVMVLLENVFCLVFWAMQSRTKTYGMPKLCPWDMDTLSWDGCCTHMAVTEGIVGVSKHLTAEENNAVEQERADRQKVKIKVKQGKSGHSRGWFELPADTALQ